MPRQEPVGIPMDEIRRTLEDLDGQRIQNRGRRRPVRVSPDEVRRTLEVLERRNSRQRRKNRRRPPRQHRVTVPEDELARTMAAITQERAEERSRARAARLQMREQADGPKEAPPTLPLAIPSGVVRYPQVPPSEDCPRHRPPRPIPHTPSPRKRAQDPQSEGLPTPAPTRPDRLRKRTRPSQDNTPLQRESLKTVLDTMNLVFATKRGNREQDHGAFADERTLPISHCSFCYRKQPPSELTTIRWRTRLSPPLLQATTALQECTDCFPAGDDAEAIVCHECSAALKTGKLPKTCAVNNMHIGCEHRYPEALDGLSPVEERLIALQASFGYITKFIVDNKTPSGLSYRKHVKGHIVVFPNKVEDLVATVLPHPLLETIENIHVSWSGSSKPGAADVGHLLQVRKSRVRDALSWLQKNNPLYEHIAIDHGEIDGWEYADGSNVPILIMDSMQRDEPSVAERTQTDHIVPDTDRGLEENRFTSIEEIIATSFILVERGADFADRLHEDFFPRTFPKLFPWGGGGPKALHASDLQQQQAPAAAGPHVNHSLSYWARYVLQRHGGRFASHPVFCFLVFNILLRSSNRRISMMRTTKGSFERVERVYETLTADRLKKAEDEMRETRKTTDPDVAFLLRELKIQAINTWTCTPAIWLSVNPNEINNPVKMRLSIHRLHDYHAAKDLLADLWGKYDKIALSIMDPYVRTGQESIFGKVSHYYATVETNDRGSLHLHGLLWLHGNMELPSLIDDIADPREQEYRARVVRYVDSVFHECLDEDAGKAVRQQRKPIHPVEEMMKDTEALSAAFDAEANFIAHCCQVHSHTYTCIKYSLKGLTDHDADKCRRAACRFRASWKIVDATGLSDDGLLAIRRNHPLVNRYNKAMAVGLRHNHDVSMILTRTKGLAMVFYITNYATKLDTPMWRRIAHAADVSRLDQFHKNLPLS
ncbi:hypothetical protein HIM_06040 [Hirsutella minnesotensis 3608]|uniref:Uncharacterized protein n=1 Tax=Hirsutella minnesotensis 3608 TaxID=1043627 RepID=A0A0F8A4Z6_9HYPO|nr:hypothetical protein HIM_06040 [Hirsutella minnesotensis 3608]